MPKVSLRKQGLARRAALSEQERAVAGSRIQETLLQLPDYIAAGSVALYSAVRDEVPTDMVIRHALAAGKAVFLPATVGAHLEFRQIDGERSLKAGLFGIPEPAEDAPVRTADEIDLVVVPGAVFDLGGQRVGYGRGYYDKALHRLEMSGRLTAFCFECQLVDLIAGEPHDVLMDRIITERRVITPRAA